VAAAAPAEQPVTPELRAALEAAVKADGSSKSLATVAFVYLFLAIGLDSVNGYVPNVYDGCTPGRHGSALRAVHLVLRGRRGDGAHFEVQSTLPIGAGLGSSAAFATALAAGLLLWRARRGNDAPGTAVTGELINFWAFRSEQLVHGTPSGLDNYTSTFGTRLRSGRARGRSVADCQLVVLSRLHVSTRRRALVQERPSQAPGRVSARRPSTCMQRERRTLTLHALDPHPSGRAGAGRRRCGSC